MSQFLANLHKLSGHVLDVRGRRLVFPAKRVGLGLDGGDFGPGLSKRFFQLLGKRSPPKLYPQTGCLGSLGWALGRRW